MTPIEYITQMTRVTEKISIIHEIDNAKIYLLN